MQEVKKPKRPLIYYYVIVLAILLYSISCLCHGRQKAR